MQITLTLNGIRVSEEIAPDMLLIDFVRAHGCKSVKRGCEVGECGACTVVLNGEAVTSCLVLAGQMQGADILTVEGLSETQIGSILQQCFVDGDAVQCGFCTPGMIMSAKALLLKNPRPSRDDIKRALAGNICRCTGYIPIVNAVEKAAALLGGGDR